MADTTRETLKAFTEGIADSIRYAESSEALINPQDFKNRIRALKNTSSQDSKTATPTKETQVVKPDSGYNSIKQVVVNPIPDEYIVPEGSITIDENGTYDVTEAAEVVVAVSGGAEIYEGEYEVIPSTSETPQVLETKNKMLLDNVVVKPIPYFEVSGPVSGKTVYIGSSVTTNLSNENN